MRPRPSSLPRSRLRAVLTMDGVGEWATTSAGMGQGSRIIFDQGNSLSPFARPALFRLHLLHRIQGQLRRIQADGARALWRAAIRADHFRQSDRPEGRRLFRLDLDYFDYCTGLTMTNASFDALFGGPPRKPESRIDAARHGPRGSIQAVTEEVVLRLRALLAERNRHEVPVPGRRRGAELRRQRQAAARRAFRDIWIQPAAGDAGVRSVPRLRAIIFTNDPRRVNNALDGMKGAYLGQNSRHAKSGGARQVRRALIASSTIRRCLREVTSALIEEKVVGWFQGRMEFGPRALGNRSILGDARRSGMQRDAQS